MKHTTLITMIFAGALIMSVFMLKYEVQGLEQELLQVERMIDSDREAIHVLRAEWSYLNDPQRLRTLADELLDLVPVQSVQVITAEQIDDYIPMVGDEIISFANEADSSSVQGLVATPVTVIVPESSGGQGQ